jgi:hypothetical protein
VLINLIRRLTRAHTHHTDPTDVDALTAAGVAYRGAVRAPVGLRARAHAVYADEFGGDR